jgi:RNA recognition motif-containing protein
MTIYVGNLSFQAEREDLLDLFGQYGEVRQCSLPLDRETGRKRGFAFIELADDAAEQKAIDDLQDVEWMGRMIRVNKATPREGGGGGGGGGRGGYSPTEAPSGWPRPARCSTNCSTWPRRCSSASPSMWLPGSAPPGWRVWVLPRSRRSSPFSLCSPS